ncbi:MAG: energy transducer TonB [Bacteroidetes bacterium]|nr:energy transducer TonB [Bacteroidota bacterium]MCW5894837.1 energy transducer TonB [Bacteroidota bacterium]
MTSPAFAATSRRPAYSVSLVYRAMETERIQQRNILLALVVSVVIHAMVIGAYFVLPAMQSPIDMTKVEWKKPRGIPVERGPINLEDYTLPSPRGGASPKATDIAAGKIVVVPDAVADKTKTLATQHEISRGDAIGGEEGTGDDEGISAGPGTGDIPDVTAEPVPFEIVEHFPEVVKRVTPQYPDLARRAGIEGKVTVRIWVTKEGKVREARIYASDNELFNDAAIEAAKQFVFTPGYMSSGPVDVWVSVPFTFKLKR